MLFPAPICLPNLLFIFTTLVNGDQLFSYYVQALCILSAIGALSSPHFPRYDGIASPAKDEQNQKVSRSRRPPPIFANSNKKPSDCCHSKRRV